MIARSSSRPATWVLSLLHVERSSARARACRERRDVGGVGGGVAIARCEISGVGVVGDDAIDACLLVAIDETISVRDLSLVKCLLLERDGVVVSSPLVRRRALAALGEAGSMLMDSGL
jgi:hypothetical protein